MRVRKQHEKTSIDGAHPPNDLQLTVRFGHCGHHDLLVAGQKCHKGMLAGVGEGAGVNHWLDLRDCRLADSLHMEWPGCVHWLMRQSTQNDLAILHPTYQHFSRQLNNQDVGHSLCVVSTQMEELERFPIFFGELAESCEV